MADPTYVKLPNNSYVEIPANATPAQLSALRTKFSSIRQATPAPSLLGELYTATDPVLGLKSASGALKELSDYLTGRREAGEQAMVTAAAKGKPVPASNTFALGSAADTAKILSGLLKPSTIAQLVATGIIPEVMLPYFGYTGAKGVLTPRQPGESTAEALQRRLLAGSQVAGSLAGGLSKPVQETAAAHMEAAGELPKQIASKLGRTPAMAEREAYVNLLKSKPAGVGPEFAGHFKAALDTGDLGEIAKTNPKSFRDAYISTKDYMNKLYQSSVQAPADRLADIPLSTEPLADAIKKAETPALRQFFPERSNALLQSWRRFKGKTTTVAGGMELLKQLNAMNQALEEMAPESASSAVRINASKAAIDSATDALRNHLYDTMEAHGETGVRAAQKRYGSLAELRDMLRKNIPRAERAEAIKPSYRPGPLLGRSITRRPLLAEMAVGGGILDPRLTTTLGVVPLVELLKTIQERGATPDAMLRRAFESVRKASELRGQLPGR